MGPLGNAGEWTRTVGRETAADGPVNHAPENFGTSQTRTSWDLQNALRLMAPATLLTVVTP